MGGTFQRSAIDFWPSPEEGEPGTQAGLRISVDHLMRRQLARTGIWSEIADVEVATDGQTAHTNCTILIDPQSGPTATLDPEGRQLRISLPSPNTPATFGSEEIVSTNPALAQLIVGPLLQIAQVDVPS